MTDDVGESVEEYLSTWYSFPLLIYPPSQKSKKKKKIRGMLVSGWLKVWKKRRRNTRSSYCRSWHYHTLGVALWWPWCAPNSDKLSTFSHLPRSCRREAMRKSGGDSFPSRPLLIVCACVSWLQSQARGFFVSNVTKPPNDTPLRNSVRELPRRPSSKGAKDYGRDGDGEGWSTTTAVRTGRS